MKFLVWICYYSCWYCAYPGEKWSSSKMGRYDICQDVDYAARFDTLESAQKVVDYLEKKEDRKALVMLEVYHG